MLASDILVESKVRNQDKYHTIENIKFKQVSELFIRVLRESLTAFI